MPTFDGTTDTDSKNETRFTLDDLLQMVAEMQIEVRVTPEGESILEEIDLPPAAQVIRKNELMSGMILAIETAPGLPADGKIILVEDEETGYVVDKSAMAEPVTSERTLPEIDPPGGGVDLM